MDVGGAPNDITGWTVIPDLPTLRTDYQAALGQQAGNYAADCPACSRLAGGFRHASGRLQRLRLRTSPA